MVFIKFNSVSDCYEVNYEKNGKSIRSNSKTDALVTKIDITDRWVSFYYHNGNIISYPLFYIKYMFLISKTDNIEVKIQNGAIKNWFS